MNASSSFPPYARDASLSNLKTGPVMLTPSSQRTALARRPFLLLRRSCPPTNVLSPTARPLLRGAAHPDPRRAAAPGHRCVTSLRSRATTGLASGLQLSGSRRHLQPRLDALPRLLPTPRTQPVDPISTISLCFCCFC